PPGTWCRDAAGKDETRIADGHPGAHPPLSCRTVMGATDTTVQRWLPLSSSCLPCVVQTRPPSLPPLQPPLASTTTSQCHPIQSAIVTYHNRPSSRLRPASITHYNQPMCRGYPWARRSPGSDHPAASSSEASTR